MGESINRFDRVVTSKGYAIKKTALTNEQSILLRKTLTVSPLTNAKYATATLQQTFAVYLESATRFYIPRMYGREQFGMEEADIVAKGRPLPATISFKGTPYEYQEDIIRTFMHKGMNGLICVPCGKGKTFMALNIAIRLGKRFLIVVDKEFLLNQWRGEIERYIDGARIGVVQGTLCQTDPAKYDITICMIQTICSRDFPESTFSGYGFSIFDEVHHLGAAYFSRTLQKIQTAYQLGLSATHVRDDGLTKVIEWYLGPPVYWEKTREPDATVTVRQVKFTTNEPDYNREETDYKGELVTARMLTNIVQSPERNKMIATLLADLLKNPYRKVLVLSERIEHLKTLEGLMGSIDPSEIGYYIGGMKETTRERGAKTARILFASYAMASEGMNIKELNTVLLASPRKKVEQSTGRILRQRKEERQAAPLILDIVDAHGIYITQWRKRLQYYKQCGYKIERVSCADEDEVEEEVVDIHNGLGCLVLDD